MTLDLNAFLRNRQYEMTRGDATLPDWRNIYRIYDCAMSAEKWIINPLYVQTDIFSNGIQQEYRVTHFHAPVYWSLNHGLLDIVTGVHEATTGVPNPTLEFGNRTLRYPYSYVGAGQVVPAPNFSEGIGFPVGSPAAPESAPPAQSGSESEQEDLEQGAPQYPQLPGDLWAILQSNPDLMCYQSPAGARTQSLHRRVWTYDDWLYLSANGRTLRAIYRLDPVRISPYASDLTWALAFDVNGGPLEMVNVAQYSMSYEFPFNLAAIGGGDRTAPTESNAPPRG